MQVRSLGQEDPLEEGMATHSSIHAWKFPWTEEPGGLQFTGSQRVKYNRSDLSMHQKKKRKLKLTLFIDFANIVKDNTLVLREELKKFKF